jgi:hypothetical protein
VTTLLKNNLGAAAANGKVGTRKPLATPIPNMSAARRRLRHNTANANIGMIAHSLTAQAKPNAAPPQPVALPEHITIEGGHRARQAKQDQPRLEQEGMGCRDGIWKDSKKPAGHRDPKRSTMANQPAQEYDVGGAYTCSQYTGDR